MTVRIVTDSTADVPAEIVAQHNITVIPSYINIEDQSYIDGVDISRREFYQKLRQGGVYPSTAAPAVGVFAEHYQRLADEGATAIISLHIADKMSNMSNSARLGAGCLSSVCWEWSFRSPSLR